MEVGMVSMENWKTVEAIFFLSFFVRTIFGEGGNGKVRELAKHQPTSTTRCLQSGCQLPSSRSDALPARPETKTLDWGNKADACHGFGAPKSRWPRTSHRRRRRRKTRTRRNHAPREFAPAAKTMSLGAWRQLASPSNIESQSSSTAGINTTCGRSARQSQHSPGRDQGCSRHARKQGRPPAPRGNSFRSSPGPRRRLPLQHRGRSMRWRAQGRPPAPSRSTPCQSSPGPRRSHPYITAVIPGGS